MSSSKRIHQAMRVGYAAFIGVAAAPRKRRRHLQHTPHKALRWAPGLVVAVATALCWSCILALPFTSAMQIPGPVVEITFPPQDHLLLGTELEIEIAMRIELLHGGIEDERVCIGMTTVFAPEDVKLDTGSSGFSERCYERQGNYTTFHASGLLPGLMYDVSAGLMNRGKLVGYSLRTFEVASIVGHADGMVIRMSISDAMDAAYQLHATGDWANAREVYLKVLEMFPTHAVALHRLGQASHQDGRTEAAISFLQQALQADPNDAATHVSMAICLEALDRKSDAIHHFRRALEIRPSHVGAALSLGLIWQSMGKYDDAMHELRKVVATVNDPQPPQEILEVPHERMVREALAWFCELVRLTATWHEADRCLSQATERFPTESRFYIDRGHLLLSGGHFEAAQREYEAAARLGSIQAMIHAADILESLGEYEASTERYIQLYGNPQVEPSHLLNQIAVMMTTVLPRILPGSQHAINIERDHMDTNLNDVLVALGRPMAPIRIDPSRIAFSTAVSMNSHHRNNRALKSKLGLMYHEVLIDPGIVLEEYVSSYAITPLPYHQQFTHGDDFVKQPKRLRVGFCSRFFYSAAVGLFMNELLPQLDASKYEVFAFGIGLSKSIKKYDQVHQIAEHVVALPRDLRVARDEIEAAELDLLIYPELGMDKTTYFLAYYRLARVQAAWWGNPDTSGVPAIDYFITSEHEHANVQARYTEKVYQMKGMGIYHELPPLPNSTITREDIRHAIHDKFAVPPDFHFYLSIEAMLHMHPDFDEALRRILNQDPLAHVFLLSSSNRKTWKNQLATRLTAHIGAANANRITFLTDVDARQEMHLLTAADAVLSGIHLSRPKTSMQAFTAGVPVVTLAGELWATRITAGFYKQMDISELTTTSLGDAPPPPSAFDGSQGRERVGDVLRYRGATATTATTNSSSTSDGASS